jgi:hypothetical protein
MTACGEPHVLEGAASGIPATANGRSTAHRRMG